MTGALKNEPEDNAANIRTLDPNVRQRRAADPGRSVWVGASAGTGKTKVLTDRVLRLMLPRPDGRPGTSPGRILCLTFTKAAASLMLARISAVLAAWATAPEESLAAALETLTGAPPDRTMREAARRLFAAVIDAPGGLKVMTIHAFCQSVLGRFPLEAGLPPQFSVIDEPQSRALLARAQDDILAAARAAPGDEIGQALRRIAVWQNEEQFAGLLSALATGRDQLALLPAERAALLASLCATLSLGPEDSEQSLIAQACCDDAFDAAALYRCCAALASGSDRSDQPAGLTLQRWLEATPDRRAAGLEAYRSIYLTGKLEMKARLATAKAVAACPDIVSIMTTEAQRLLALEDRCRAARCAGLTADLLWLGQLILARYEELKARRAFLDYDDLIRRTRLLFDTPDIAPWVMFKLDGGLDHILVDEAQDTNPEQWDIIARLAAEFHSGAGARDDAVTRTSFVVGDEKQSIYSFQRASPAEFGRKRTLFTDAYGASEEILNISFRSAPPVLALVDHVFAPEPMRCGMGRDPVSHVSHRRGQAGLCELWPLFTPDSLADEAPWTPPLTAHDSRSGAAKLAAHIAATIAGWLATGERLPSQNRPIAPGDIMILMRTRTAFVAQMVRELKRRNIPVSGVDRMVLGEQIAVMDLLALAQCALLPQDDLSLACVLKSPLVGLDETALYDLAAARHGSLWDALLSHPAHANITAYLKARIEDAAAAHPYEFFARILQSPCPADPVSGLRAIRARLGEDALDPLGEFLAAALNFERANIPALQGFLVWQRQNDLTVKRELEEAGAAVRIMTVHGAKGLQAPVVILPDTTRTSQSRRIDSLLWPRDTGFSAPLWAPRRDDRPALYSEARAAIEAAQDDEYRRLLYVAMTRAEDRLYVTGHAGNKEILADSWYHWVRDGFARLPGAQAFAPPTPETDGNSAPRPLWRYEGPQTRPPDGKGADAAQEIAGRPDLPGWLLAAAPAEPLPPRPLVPSRPDLAEPPVRSPLNAATPQFRRGTLIHALLQTLPGLPPPARRTAAQRFLARPAHGLDSAQQQQITEEIMAIIEHPACAPLFGPGSHAEVPLTGLVNGRPVSARIDRLVVTDDAVLIVDYKTNRPPPQAEKDVPPLYRDQMRNYRDIIALIYPGRDIHCYLLWTDGPILMKLSDLQQQG